MGYTREGDVIRLSIDMSEEEYTQYVLDMGALKRAAPHSGDPYEHFSQIEGSKEVLLRFERKFSREQFTGYLLNLGYLHATAFQASHPLGWHFVERMNRLLAGTPDYVPYEIPENREQDFEMKSVLVVEGVRSRHPEHN